MASEQIPPTQRSLGEAVAMLRAERGLGQKQLAAHAQIHRNYLADMERGRRNPTFQVLLRVSTALDISLSELMARAELYAASASD